MAAASPASSAFELKSAALTLVAVVLKTTDLAPLAQALDERFGEAPELFDQDPVAIDLSFVHEALAPIDFPALVRLLRGYRMLPVAVRAGNAQQMDDARAAGLSEAHGGAAAAKRTLPPVGPPGPADPEPAVLPAGTPQPQPQLPQPQSLGAAHASAQPALVIDKPLRSGQRVYARGCDLVVLAVVSYGAEVIADGNIHVYAPLRGRALAGALGDTAARIFSTCMEPQLLSIAGIYRTAEHELAEDVQGKPAQVRLDGEKLLVEALKTD